MKGMFNGCSSLLSIPDISKWDTINMTDISEMFKGYSSLKILPDISKWNTENITNINRLFSDCKSLISLPDISKWNTNNIINISYLFNGCSSIKSLPDISKWDKSNKILKRNSKYCSGRPIKVVFLGSSGVGGQALIRASMGIQFNDKNFYVQNGTFVEKKFFIIKKEMTADLWNIISQEKFWSLNKIFLGNSNIIIFVYSIASKKSFENLNYLIEMAIERNDTNFQGIIIGNKKDLFDNEQVSENEARDFAKNHNYKFYLTSAKEDPITTKNIIEEIIKNYISSLYYE